MLKKIIKRVIALAMAGALTPMITVPFVKWEISAVNLSQDAVLQKYSIEDLKATQAFILNAPYDGNGRVIDAYEDGKIDCFDMVMLRKMYSEQTQKTGSFYSLSSDMVHDNDAKYGTMIMSDEFYSKRVIVKADTSYDFSDFSPKEVINGPDNLYVLQFETVENAELCMNALRKDEHIEYVELDEYMSCGEIETEQTNANSWGVSAIEADKYAEYIGNNYNSSVVVAVVDTGVASHDFLKGRLLDTGYDLVDNDSDPNDKHYHGTHVAGTVVDCTPGLNVKIMPVRVLNENGSGSNLNVGNGIRYATEHGADVINLSLGGEGCSKYIDDSIEYAVDNGVTVVVAAGNDGDNTVHYCPSHLDSCIVVAACDSNNEKAYFSNYGNSVDVIAPGVDIRSCIPGGSYKQLNGTSMATPHISAAAAMIKYAEPNITPAKIEQKIKDVSLDLGDMGKDVYFGYGLPKLSNLIKDNPNIKPSITISETELSMVVGDNKLLTAYTVPSGQTVSWKSSNEKVATVENGNVKVISAGTAKITASFEYNEKSYSAECSVKVTDNSNNIIESGQCGDNAYYTLDGNGLLTFKGTGKMWDYNSSSFSSSSHKHGYTPLEGNTKIKKVIVEEGITSLGTCILYRCSEIKEVSLPESLEIINEYSLGYCTSLISINIPVNVSRIGEYEEPKAAFSGCSSLKYIYIDPNNEKYADDNGAIISKDGTILYYIPLAKNDYVISDKLEKLAASCAYGNKSITELSVPKSVTSIGPDAFSGCSNLKNLQLNSGLTSIGSYAFYKTGIEELNIPSTVTAIGGCAFRECRLSKLTFDLYGVELLDIGQLAFEGNSIKSLILPERVGAISSDAFRWNSIEYARFLGYNTCLVSKLYNFSGSNSPSFDSSVIIQGYAGSTAEHYTEEYGNTFVNIDETFVIPNNGDIGDGLHWEYNDGVLRISGNGDMPSYECGWSLGCVNFYDNITPWFSYRLDIKKVVIEEGITSIGDGAFAYCSNISEINIPDTIEYIGHGIITHTLVKEVYLPASVSKIDETSFIYVEQLEKITILNPDCYFDWSYNYYMIPETAVIYGYKNSTAQKYAEKYNRTFVTLD